MTNEEAIKQLQVTKQCDVDTVAQIKALDKAIDALRSATGEKEKDHFHSEKMVPLTLEQLRDMIRPTPVWAEIEGKTVEGWDGYWCLCVRGYILTPGQILMFAEKMRGAKFYIYPPANIDLEAWTGCPYCGGVPHMEGVELKPCASGYIGAEVAFGKCRDDQCVGMVVYYRNAAAGYLDFDYCPFCGKPQTPKAWYEQEKRLMALMN